MSFIKWFKENVFDWSAESPSRFTRPPKHDPGWYNRQRAKNKASTRLGGTVAKKRTGKQPPSG